MSSLATKPDQPSADSFAGAAWLLDCDVAAIKAVAEVESGPEGAFLASGEPVILYERHLFHRLTVGKYDREWVPDLESDVARLSAPTPGGYGSVSIQHKKLAAAAKFNREAALKACSWGLFQILGLNYEQAGYPDVQRFVTAMYRSADDHLRAFAMFILHDPRLLEAIQDRHWSAFAGAYNGPNFQKNQYDVKLAIAYRKHGGRVA